MKLHLVCSLILLLLATSCGGNKKPVTQEITYIPDAMAAESVSAPFTLAEGDEISISVWRQEDLKRNVSIDPSGYLHYPLIGQLKASGLTIPQLQEQLTTRLSKYVVDPQVDINILSLKGQEVYVLGEVKMPGAFVLDRKTSALQAIVKAGGFTRESNTSAVLLARSEEKVIRVSSISLDMDDMQKAPNSYQNVSLRSGDILYVPPSKIASVEKFMTRLNNIITPFASLGRSIVLGGDAVDTITGKRNATVIAQ